MSVFIFGSEATWATVWASQRLRKILTYCLVFVLISERRKYDLKGSTVDREASDKEKEKDLPTLKDNDFVKDGTKVVIGDEAKDRLMETLTADVEVIHFPTPRMFSIIHHTLRVSLSVPHETPNDGLFAVVGRPRLREGRAGEPGTPRT